ncbi:MAG TPA: radical SAM protein [Pyrodictium sp.]|nr:radical SAM protein [Pyrodictium sp.]
MKSKIGREHGTIVKRGCRYCIGVALLYPAVYSAAVASLAYQELYYLINMLEYAYAERFVAKRMRGHEDPPRSLDTGAPLSKFKLIIAPLAYEADYLGLMRLLLAANIEPLRDRRRDGPIIAVGGPAAMASPQLALEIADIVLVGDIEPTIPKLVEAIYHGDLEEIMCKDGFLVQGCEKPVRKLYTADLDKAFHPILQFRIPGSGEPWGEAFLVEVSRGCPHMCSFCLAAHLGMPYRYRSFKKLVEIIEEGVNINRVSRVAFYALSLFDHPQADKLVEHVIEMGLSASIGSLRADLLDDKRVELIARLGQKVLTIAPETLSEKVCKVIRKCVEWERVVEVSKAAWRYGMHTKYYLILGIPGEEQRDIEETAKKLAELLSKSPTKNFTSITVNPLIPKPFTPLQWTQLVSRKAYRERIKIIKNILKGIRVEELPYNEAVTQVVIDRGDKNVALALRHAAEVGASYASILSYLKRQGVHIENYTRQLDLNEVPQWHRMIDVGIPLVSLKRTFELTLQNI